MVIRCSSILLDRYYFVHSIDHSAVTVTANLHVLLYIGILSHSGYVNIRNCCFFFTILYYTCIC